MRVLGMLWLAMIGGFFLIMGHLARGGRFVVFLLF